MKPCLPKAAWNSQGILPSLQTQTSVTLKSLHTAEQHDLVFAACPVYSNGRASGGTDFRGGQNSVDCRDLCSVRAYAPHSGCGAGRVIGATPLSKVEPECYRAFGGGSQCRARGIDSRRDSRSRRQGRFHFRRSLISSTSLPLNTCRPSSVSRIGLFVTSRGGSFFNRHYAHFSTGADITGCVTITPPFCCG